LKGLKYLYLLDLSTQCVELICSAADITSDCWAQTLYLRR